MKNHIQIYHWLHPKRQQFTISWESNMGLMFLLNRPSFLLNQTWSGDLFERTIFCNKHISSIVEYFFKKRKRTTSLNLHEIYYTSDTRKQCSNSYRNPRHWFEQIRDSKYIVALKQRKIYEISRRYSVYTNHCWSQKAWHKWSTLRLFIIVIRLGKVLIPLFGLLQNRNHVRWRSW